MNGGPIPNDIYDIAAATGADAIVYFDGNGQDVYIHSDKGDDLSIKKPRGAAAG